MLRRLLGGPDAGRNAILAVLPAVVGAILLLGSGDRPSTKSSLLETTRGPAWPTLLEDPGPTSTSVASTSAAEETAGAAMAESLSPAAAGPAGPAELTPGSAWAPSRRANATSGLGSTSVSDSPTAASSGTSTPAASPAGAEDDAGSVAPMDAAPPNPTAGPTSTSAAPTTRAAETTTTTAPAPATGGPARDRAVEAEVVPLTNQDRSAQGLGALSRNACLDSVASRYAEQMARSGVLAHNSGAGPAIQGCRANSSWGDNVGTAAPCDTARLEREWMASPGHRRNILDGAFQHIGVGAWTDEQGGCWVQVLFSS